MKTLKEKKRVQGGIIVLQVPEDFGLEVNVSITPVKEKEWDNWSVDEMKNVQSIPTAKEPIAQYASKDASLEPNTTTIEVDAEKEPLKELVSMAAQGKDIVLTQSGKPVARIVLLKPRVMGLHRGSVVWISDDFDAPLPDEFWSGEP